MSDNFKTDTLDSLCELIVDCPHSTPTWTTFGYVVIRNQNIIDGVLDLSSPSYTDYSGYRDRTKRASPQENDIVITREAPMGRVCLIPKEPSCCLGQRQVLLRADRNKISAEYLYWSLRSPFVQRQILINEGTGATVSNMRIPVLKALKIPRLASIEIENKKARDLSNIQNKIQLNTQINQTLEQIALAMFKSWFIDFDPVRAKVQALSDGLSLEQAELAAMQAISGKTPEELTALSQTQPDRYAELAETAKAFPCEMVEVDGSEVPKGWEYKLADELFDIGIGKTPPRKETEWFSTNPDDMQWISIKDMGNSGVFITESSEFLTNQAVDKFNIRKIPENTVLLSFKLTIGRVSITTCETTTNEAIAHFKITDKSFLTTEYLYLFFQQFDFNSLGSTSSIATAVNSKTIKGIEILIPNEELIKAFQMKISNIFAQIKNLTMENKNLVETRDLLLPKLLNGDVL